MLKLKTAEYASVKRWFAEGVGVGRKGTFKESTRKYCAVYLSAICKLIGKSPDELAVISDEEMVKVQMQVITHMKAAGSWERRSARTRIRALHSFWRYNGRQLPNALFTNEMYTQFGDWRRWKNKNPCDPTI